MLLWVRRAVGSYRTTLICSSQYRFFMCGLLPFGMEAVSSLLNQRVTSAYCSFPQRPLGRYASTAVSNGDAAVDRSHAAERIDRHAGGINQFFKQLPAEVYLPGVAGRRRHRRENGEVATYTRGLMELWRVMAGCG